MLDSVVKERFDQVFRLNRGRAFYSSLVSRQAVFEEVFLSSQPLALPINLASLVSGRRIIQRSKPLSTTSFTASDQPDRSRQQRSTTALPARRI
ncbi:hypothetical protein V8Z77_21255, partial [Stutzerimonas stutzeri]|uniref:hypothetical protein n=1 Tax=Stutzerimonas stutzeri TaxID=316 RepID=UPI0031D57EB0